MSQNSVKALKSKSNSKQKSKKYKRTSNHEKHSGDNDRPKKAHDWKSSKDAERKKAKKEFRHSERDAKL